MGDRSTRSIAIMGEATIPPTKLFNLPDSPQIFRLLDGPYAGAWRDAITQEAVALDATSELALPAWGWRVLEP